ncbi:MAG TPA: energy transducer TonB [Pyrinomonadaceae bacterium]|jgi:hypothetical protein
MFLLEYKTILLRPNILLSINLLIVFLVLATGCAKSSRDENTAQNKEPQANSASIENQQASAVENNSNELTNTVNSGLSNAGTNSNTDNVENVDYVGKITNQPGNNIEVVENETVIVEPPRPTRVENPNPLPTSALNTTNTADDDPPANYNPRPAPTTNPCENPPKKISLGVMNGLATNLVNPVAPEGVNASGTVSVQVEIDEEGSVTKATAVSGLSQLHAVSVRAAKQSKFKPVVLKKCNISIKGTGIISYNFSPR